MDRRVPGSFLIGLGAGLILLVIGSAPADPTKAIVGTGPFVLIGATISFVGGWLWLADDPVEAHGDKLLLWTVGSGVTFAAIGYLTMLGVSAPMDGRLQVIVQSFTAGSLAGILVGLYDGRSRRQYAELQRERDRVADLATKSKRLHEYGKAVYHSEDVEEVSELSIDVLDLLIDGYGAAVLVVNEDSELLDSTVPGDRTDFLRGVATAVAGRTNMEPLWIPTDVDHAIPEDLDFENLLCIPVEVGETTVVFLSLLDSAEAYTDEDLDLLGTFAAHVGTALPIVRWRRNVARFDPLLDESGYELPMDESEAEPPSEQDWDDFPF